MTTVPRAQATAMRVEAMRRLGDLLDEIEPGDTDPAIVEAHTVVTTLSAALATASPWSQTVTVDLPAHLLPMSAHKQLVARR